MAYIAQPFIKNIAVIVRCSLNKQTDRIPSEVKLNTKKQWNHVSYVDYHVIGWSVLANDAKNHSSHSEAFAYSRRTIRGLARKFHNTEKCGMSWNKRNIQQLTLKIYLTFEQCLLLIRRISFSISLYFVLRCCSFCQFSFSFRIQSVLRNCISICDTLFMSKCRVTSSIEMISHAKYLSHSTNWEPSDRRSHEM